MDRNEVFLIASGPSAKQIDLYKIDSEKTDIACVNDWPIAYKDIFFDLRPRFLFLLDDLYFIDESEVENIYPNVNKLRQTLNHVDWKLTIVAPKKRVIKLDNTNIAYDYINTNCILQRPNIFLFYLMDRNVINPGYHNVVVGALYYLILKKYRKIAFAGTDLSDFKNLGVDKDNRVYTESVHSYGESPRYYYDTYDGFGITKMSDWLYCWVLMLREFEVISKYAKYKDADVINLSEESIVDSFKKMNWNEYLKLRQ